MLKGVFKQKDKVKAVLDKLSDMIIEIGQWLQASGCDYITLREPGVAADLLSPRTFKEFIQATTDQNPGRLEIAQASAHLRQDGHPAYP